jgi:hypothetical protein
MGEQHRVPEILRFIEFGEQLRVPGKRWLVREVSAILVVRKFLNTERLKRITSILAHFVQPFARDVWRALAQLHARPEKNEHLGSIPAALRGQRGRDNRPDEIRNI